jgi:hypothetical protein
LSCLPSWPTPWTSGSGGPRPRRLTAASDVALVSLAPVSRPRGAPAPAPSVRAPGALSLLPAAPSLDDLARAAQPLVFP